MISTLRIAESFTSIQGEGPLTGMRMHFIRLGGCAVKSCFLHPMNSGLCDTNWQLHWQETIEKLADETFSAVGEKGWVCVTGGEPLNQKKGLRALLQSLKDMGIKTMLQTSGTISCDFSWSLVDHLCVSPKCNQAELKIRHGDELKIVYTGQKLEQIAEYASCTNFRSYWLQPLWADGKATNMPETIAMVHRLSGSFGLSIQAHKYMAVR